MSEPANPHASPQPTALPLTILFGSQTGTAETLAKRAVKAAAHRGFAPRLVDMEQTDVTQLAAETSVLVVTSTYDDGEPPDNARALHDALADGQPGTQFEGVRYSVCGLGEMKYVEFCKCGRDFDAFFEKWGAARIAPRADIESDDDHGFDSWLATALAALAHGAEKQSRRGRGPTASAGHAPVTTVVHDALRCRSG